MCVLDSENHIGKVVAVAKWYAFCIGRDFNIQGVHSLVANCAVALNCSHMGVVKYPKTGTIGSGIIPAEVARRDSLCLGHLHQAKQQNNPVGVPKSHGSFLFHNVGRHKLLHGRFDSFNETKIGDWC